MSQVVLSTGWTRIPAWKLELAKVAGLASGSFVYISRSWEVVPGKRRRRRAEMRMFGAASDVESGSTMYQSLEALSGEHGPLPTSSAKRRFKGLFAARAMASIESWMAANPDNSRSCLLRIARSEILATRIQGKMKPTSTVPVPSRRFLRVTESSRHDRPLE